MAFDRTAYDRVYREANREKLRRYGREWKAAKRVPQAEYRATISFRAKEGLRQAAIRARKRGLPFDLDMAWALPKYEAMVCEATGLPLDVRADLGAGKRPRTPTIDRVEPSKGYLKANCMVVCAQYNMAKNKWDRATLTELAYAIVNADRGKATLQ